MPIQVCPSPPGAEGAHIHRLNQRVAVVFPAAGGQKPLKIPQKHRVAVIRLNILAHRRAGSARHKHKCGRGQAALPAALVGAEAENKPEPAGAVFRKQPVHQGKVKLPVLRLQIHPVQPQIQVLGTGQLLQRLRRGNIGAVVPAARTVINVMHIPALMWIFQYGFIILLLAQIPVKYRGIRQGKQI